jgi:cell division protein FtsI (penicillin-binding protein 3)
MTATNLTPATPGAWRRWTAVGLLLVSATAIIGRAWDLQVEQRVFLTHEGDIRHIRTVTLPGFRGAIRDRRGEPLALSAPVDSVWAIPAELLAAPPYVVAMAKMLGEPTSQLQHLLEDHRDKQFVYLRRQIDPDEAQRLLDLKAPGVFAQREYRRYYPAGEIASHIVGFTDIDGNGQEGLELANDSSLRGYAGSRSVVRDRTGRIVEDSDDEKPAQPGQDLSTTIDLHLQYIAYRELKRAVEEHHAPSGMIVIADARCGDILALASQPGYNPNRAEDRDSIGLRDRSITDVFEPGSTIKPLLISEALESGAFNLSSLIDTSPGTFRVNNYLTVHDTHSYGVVDMARLLAKSSNVGAAKVGLKLGAQSVWSNYQRFGIGEPVDAGLPGEGTSVMRPFSEWGEVATATASYGYGISVNALQMLRAYSAIANDGLMPSFSIVKRDSPPPPQRVMPPEIAREVRHLLEGVVSHDGTAVGAEIPGYRVAGKTGTARLTDASGYVAGHYRALFIGMVPAEHPRLIGIIVISDPRPAYAGQLPSGGIVAGPVFSRVMDAGLRLLQVPPDEMPDGRGDSLAAAPAPKLVATAAHAPVAPPAFQP